MLWTVRMATSTTEGNMAMFTADRIVARPVVLDPTGALDNTAYIEKMIEEMGGAEAIRESFREYHRINERMREERPRLMEMYPDKWVAVGKDGLVAVGDSLEGVLDEVDRLEIPRGDIVWEHLDTDPPILLL